MKQPGTRAAPRFYVPLRLSPGAVIELPERSGRHVAVLRLRPGDMITLFNGEGGEFTAELLGFSREGGRARVVSSQDIERESPLSITLAQCVASGDRMDLTLQKATELGVRAIVPVESERTIVKLSQDRADRRIAHWRNVAIAACEQCGRNRVPEVSAILDLDAFLVSAAADALRLVLAPDSALDLKSAGPVPSVILLVGPEGGLSAAERQRAEARGFVPVRFGPRVLRTETAPLAAIAAMQALWGDC